MSRRNTQALNSINRICNMQKLEPQTLYERAKMLLSIYRDVCWTATDRARDVEGELTCYCSGELEDALVYLEEFAPEAEKCKFEDTIASLFQTNWLVELVDQAMMKVKDFPYNGNLYFEILSMAYLHTFKYTESDMLEMLHLERSNFYDKKKEAILVFGLSLWNDALPKIRMFIQETAEELNELPREALCV